MSSEVSSVYANALFSFAMEKGDAALQETRSDLRQCAVLFSLNPDLTNLLSLPTISVDELMSTRDFENYKSLFDLMISLVRPPDLLRFCS